MKIVEMVLMRLYCMNMCGVCKYIMSIYVVFCLCCSVLSPLYNCPNSCWESQQYDKVFKNFIESQIPLINLDIYINVCRFCEPHNTKSCQLICVTIIDAHDKSSHLCTQLKTLWEREKLNTFCYFAISLTLYYS